MDENVVARSWSGVRSAGAIWLSWVETLLHAEREGQHAQDVGNVMKLDHVNLEVPDLETCRLFYGEGLGLTVDASTMGSQRGGLRVVWYNVGAQQMHIAMGPTAQRLPPGACIGMVLPDLQQVARQLEAVQELLPAVSFQWVGEGRALEVHCPYGNTVLLHQGLDGFPAARGIAYLALRCHAGTAAAVAEFYSGTFGARSAVVAGGAGVVLGPGCRLLLWEDDSMGGPSDEAVKAAYEGWHFAMYVADFSSCYRRCEALGLICNDHPYRDKVHSLEDALANRQFRIQDVPLTPHPAAPLALRMGHEVRSMHHPRFMCCLYNRGGPGFDTRP